jgi:hypothetical protein
VDPCSRVPPVAKLSPLAALDRDIEPEEQKRPQENGRDGGQYPSGRRERIEVVVDRRDNDTDNDPEDRHKTQMRPAPPHGSAYTRRVESKHDSPERVKRPRDRWSID